jgi:hypothetical protein
MLSTTKSPQELYNFALNDKNDHSLTAGVHHYWYLGDKAAHRHKTIRDAYQKLDEVEDLQDKIMDDLWKANAFESLVVQIMWQDWDNDKDEEEMDEAFHTYSKLITPDAMHQSPPPPPKQDQFCKAHRWCDHETSNCKSDRKCHTCRCHGHIAANCKHTVCFCCREKGHLAQSCDRCSRKPFFRNKGKKF